MGVIGTFGEVVFQVSESKIKTFQDYNRSANARWSKHDIIGKKPIFEFIGPDQEEVSFTMQFNINFGVYPEKELARLRHLRDNGYVARLIIGPWQVSWNYFCIESLKEKHKVHDNMGNLLSAEVDITLKEYVR